MNMRLDLQAILGHDAWFDPCRYELLTAQDNAGLPTPDLLEKAVLELVGTDLAGDRSSAYFPHYCWKGRAYSGML